MLRVRGAGAVQGALADDDDGPSSRTPWPSSHAVSVVSATSATAVAVNRRVREVRTDMDVPFRGSRGEGSEREVVPFGRQQLVP